MVEQIRIIMKAEFLKLAKVKDEKSFYKKYPTEEAFFKAHPEAKKHIKKAQVGLDVNKNGIPDEQENTSPQNIIQNFGIGAQTLGRIQGTPAPITQPGMQGSYGFGGMNYTGPQGAYAPDTSDPNWMNRNTGGMPEETSQVNKNYTGYQGIVSNTSSKSFGDKAAPYIGAAKDIISGIGSLKAQGDEKDRMRQMRKITDLYKIASGTREEEPERRYVRPEDMIIQPDQMFPTYGVGTNVLARDGAEIQNTYAPGYLYDDLGYEPLNDSEQVKQYYRGGRIPMAQDGGGFMDFMQSQGGGQALGMLTGALSNNSGESQIGQGIGAAAGTAFGGPVGGMIGGALGGAVGGLFNTSQKSIKRDRRAIQKNMDTIMGNQFGQSFQNQYSNVVRNGGDVPNYEEGGQLTNPQLITRFGELDEQDFYDYAHEGMDTLRAGGNLRSYTPPTNRAMQTYAMGGELQTHWGGHAETMSQNPYLPGNGETVMFRGKSHDERSSNGETGIGITYGNSPVEVERGEPAVKLKDGSSGEENLTVYGNLKIPNEYIPLLGDEKAKGKKFKNYIAEISKDEARQNKLIEKSTTLLNDLDVKNSFDKLKFESLSANIKGANMKLKSIADKKINAANLQNAINDTAEEYGLDADALARGKGKFNKEALQEYAEYGKSIPKAQNGTTASFEGKNIKRQFKLDNGITRTVYEGDIIVDRDNKGKILTSKKATSEDFVDYKYDPDSKSYTKTFGNKTKRKYFIENRRVIEYDAKGNLVKKGNYDLSTDKPTKWDPSEKDKKEAMKAIKPGAYRSVGQIAEEDSRAAQENSRYVQPTPQPRTATPVQQTSEPAPRQAARRTSQAPVQQEASSNTPQEEQYTSKYGLVPWQGNKLGLKEKTKSSFSAKEWDDIADALGFTGKGNEEFQTFLLNNPDSKPLIQARHKELYGKDPFVDTKLGYGWSAADLKTLKKSIPPTTPLLAEKPSPAEQKDKTYQTASYKRSIVMDVANQILPFIRPTDQEPLDPSQLMGEMYALSNNQLEPVQAQSYQPNLLNTYDISLQDQLNANQADFNATQRMVGYNPAALAQLNAQKYAANTGVLGEQFRQNQAMDMGIYNANTQTLNDAKLKNLEIFDRQYGRQSQAKSNTKAITQAALSSISDKYAKNRLENRELGIYENMYNYRFDPSGRAINMNPLYQPNMPTVYNEQKNANMLPVYDADGQQTGWRPAAATPGIVADGQTQAAKFGKAVKKYAKNGSIVKSYKNL